MEWIFPTSLRIPCIAGKSFTPFAVLVYNLFSTNTGNTENLPCLCENLLDHGLTVVSVADEPIPPYSQTHLVEFRVSIRNVIPDRLCKNSDAVVFFRNCSLTSLLNRTSRVVATENGRLLYCNLTFVGGGAWYVDGPSMIMYWLAFAEMLDAGHPVFVNETRSTSSPDTHTTYFLDFDGSESLLDSLVHLFVLDVVTLLSRTFMTVGLELPQASHCLVFAIKGSGGKFGCHVILNSVLIDRHQARALSIVSNGLWAETGWAATITLDSAANSGLRPILSSKIRYFPMASKSAIPVDVGRTYDILCTFHYTAAGVFEQSSVNDETVLFQRPWRFTDPVYDFKVDDMDSSGSLLVFSPEETVQNLTVPWGDRCSSIRERIGNRASYDALDLAETTRRFSSPGQLPLSPTTVSVVYGLSITSILPLAHPGAVRLHFNPNPFLPEPGLTKGNVGDLDIWVVAALGIDCVIANIFFERLLEKKIHPPLHLLQDSQGVAVYLVMPLNTRECPNGVPHKSASRELWFGRACVTLRCSSRRCRGGSSRYVKSYSWSHLGEIWNDTMETFQILRQIVKAYLE